MKMPLELKELEDTLKKLGAYDLDQGQSDMEPTPGNEQRKGRTEDFLRRIDAIQRTLSLYEQSQRLEMVEKLAKWAQNAVAVAFLFIILLVVANGIWTLCFSMPLLSDKVMITLLTCSTISSLLNLMAIVFKYVYK